jgi:hypothetical protein
MMKNNVDDDDDAMREYNKELWNINAKEEQKARLFFCQ